MNQTVRRIAPVLASIAVILLIAVLRARSKVVAAITATMPINIALGLWIVYVAEGGEPSAVLSFIQSMFVGLVATAIWLLTVWLAARAGWDLPWLLVVGYVSWGLTIACIFAFQSVVGS
jgi:hypothetical protein